jgi:hypothetical protein
VEVLVAYFKGTEDWVIHRFFNDTVWPAGVIPPKGIIFVNW